MRALWRFGLWGISAALALAAAAWSAHSDFGTQRLVNAFSVPATEMRPPAPSAAQLLARSLEAENETRRLAEAVRLINVDRDRLLARVRTLERNLDEVTDSIAHVRAAALPRLCYGSVTYCPRNDRADPVSSRYTTLVARQTESPVIVIAAIVWVVPSKFGPPESLEVVDVDDPKPGPQEIVVRVRAAASDSCALLSVFSPRGFRIDSFRTAAQYRSPSP